MSSESITPEEAARAIEYPDRVGFKPDNPYLTNFRPYIPAGVQLPELPRSGPRIESPNLQRCQDLAQRKFNVLSSQAGLDLSPYRFHPGPVLLIWRTENLAPEKPSFGRLSSLNRSSCV